MNIEVKKVDLNLYEIDRLKLRIDAKDQSIKHLEEENIKLKHKLDNKENWGLNCMLFSYEELITILLNKYHGLHDYIGRWFILEDDCRHCNSIFDEQNYDYELYFGEDGIEVEQDGYWLVNLKTDYAYTFKDLSKLNRKIYELEKESSSKEL